MTRYYKRACVHTVFPQTPQATTPTQRLNVHLQCLHLCNCPHPYIKAVAEGHFTLSHINTQGLKTGLAL